MSPLANGPPLSPRVISPPLSQPPVSQGNPYSSLKAPTPVNNGKRSPTPSFSNTFLFGNGKNNLKTTAAENGMKSDRPKSPLTAADSKSSTKRSGSPSFPNPFAFARKLSGAFASENTEREKRGKGSERRTMSPSSVAVENGTNGKCAPLVTVSPYAAIRKVNGTSSNGEIRNKSQALSRVRYYKLIRWCDRWLITNVLIQQIGWKKFDWKTMELPNWWNICTLLIELSICWTTNRFIDLSIDWLAVRGLIDWLTLWSIDWSFDWLIDWLIEGFIL